MIEGALFDMDGLLIDSEPLWQRAEIEIFADVGLQLSRELCLRTRGRKLEEVVGYWYAERPWAGASPGEVRDAIVARMRQLIASDGRAKPGVEHALDFVEARGLTLAVASSSDYALIEIVLERLALRSRFTPVHSGQDERRGKPDPAIFLTAARKLGVAPERCVVFEDAPGGVAAARAAGMRCVAVPDAAGAGPGGLEAERIALGEADLILESLGALDAHAWNALVG